MAKRSRKGAWLYAGLAAALAVMGGLVIRILPFLQHWAIYVLWGPVWAMVEVWIHSATSVHDRKSGEYRNGPPDLVHGLIVGVTHLVAVTVVWYAVTRGLVLKVHDSIGP